MPQNSLNPVDALVALLLLVFSPELAKVIGPYAIIILASGTGAAWSLGRREKSEQKQAVWYFCKIIFTACLVSVGAAHLIKELFKLNAEIHWLLAPVGLVIGGVGDDWPNVGKWVIGRLGRLIDRKIETQGSSGGDDAH